MCKYGLLLYLSSSFNDRVLNLHPLTLHTYQRDVLTRANHKRIVLCNMTFVIWELITKIIK